MRLQDRFSFTGVAAASASAAAATVAGNWAQDKFKLNLDRDAHGNFLHPVDAIANFGARNTAATLANAATRSVIEGTSFGDNILAGLPDVIVQTIGAYEASRIAGVRQQAPRNQFAQADIGVRSDAPTPEEQYLAEIVVTGRRLTDQAAKKGRGLLNWIDGVFDTNLSGNNPHDRRKKSNTIVIYQPGVRTGAGYDRMGQPLNGRSSYDAGSQFNNIVSDAGNVSLGTTFRRLGEWSTYTVPDATRRNADIWDPYRGMSAGGRAFAMQSDRLTGGTISGIATGLSIQFGADSDTQNLVYGLGSAADGLLIASGSMAGARLPGIGNQLELNIINGENGVHGNSRLSGRTTYLYQLQTKDGVFLKYGISINPDTRYPKSFMMDKEVFRITSGTRADMIALEREMVIANPGPLSREPWAIKAREGR